MLNGGNSIKILKELMNYIPALFSLLKNTFLWMDPSWIPKRQYLERYWEILNIWELKTIASKPIYRKNITFHSLNISTTTSAANISQRVSDLCLFCSFVWGRMCELSHQGLWKLKQAVRVTFFQYLMSSFPPIPCSKAGEIKGKYLKAATIFSSCHEEQIAPCNFSWRKALLSQRNCVCVLKIVWVNHNHISTAPF